MALTATETALGAWRNWRDALVLGTSTMIHCGFKSHRAYGVGRDSLTRLGRQPAMVHHSELPYASVAQRTEQDPSKVLAAGSSPARGTQQLNNGVVLRADEGG